MSDLQDRLTQQLEPALSLADPRPRLSAYHDMPYAIFRYAAEDECTLDEHVTEMRSTLADWPDRRADGAA